MQQIKKIIKENYIFILILLSFTLLINIKLPYYISASGGTININDRIEIKEEKQKKTNGSLNMLYVTEYEATIPTYILSYIFKDWEREKISDISLNSETSEDIYERNRVMLDNSIQNAIFVAYNNASKKIDIKGYNNYVFGTTIDSEIKVGDKIIKIDNQEVTNIEDIKKVINEKQIGDKIELTVIRKDKEKKIDIEIKEENNKKIVGIMMITNYEYNLDPDINIKFKKSESGSSGGLMMALSIYNAISNKDIIKGRKIAGTGTIDIEGNVGEIDGIKYKLKGAVKNKMDIVLVPEANYKEALKVKEEKKYNITIVSIKNFKEAIDYLENN